MKKFLPMMLFLIVSMAAYPQDCYNLTRSKGIALFEQKKYTEARKVFEAAKACPDKPESNDIDEWLGKIPYNNDKIWVRSVSFVDVSENEEGVVPSLYYTDEMDDMVTKVVVENTNKKDKKMKLDLLIKDVNGIKVTNDVDSFTETMEVTLKPGTNNILFSSLGDYLDEFENGVYSVEVWNGKKKMKAVEIEVKERERFFIVDGNREDFEKHLEYMAGTTAFSVATTESSFIVRIKPSWVTINELVPGTNSFSISYTANSSNEVRSGLMEVCAGETMRVVINLIQEGNPTLARKFGDRMFKDIKLKINVGANLTFFSSSASGTLGSVIDYGVTDVSSLAYLERPDYKPTGGFSLSLLADFPFTDRFFLETGLGFHYFGVKNSFSNDELVLTLSGVSYHLDYGCVEKYRMSYLEIPILAGYKLKLNSVSSIRFNAGFVIGIGIAAKCKLDNGYSNFTSQGYYGNSTFSGEVNLYSGRYEINQKYSTGSSPRYSYTGSKNKPFKRGNFGLSIGAAYDFGRFEVGLSYTFGLSNIGNNSYFGSTNRIGGCLFAGEQVLSNQPIYGYKHRISCLQLVFNYCL